MQEIKRFVLALIFLLGLICPAIYSQVGINTTDPKATLDVHPHTTDGRTVEGIIPPNLTRAQLMSKDALYGTDQDGAFIYISAIDGTLPPSGTKYSNITNVGYYYYDGVNHYWRLFSGKVSEALNGLTVEADGTAVLGGVLTKNTTIDAANYDLSIIGSSSARIVPHTVIGSNTPPAEFSLLELHSGGNSGLRLPHLTTTERNTMITAAFKANRQAEGLAVFNTTTQCVEYWNALRWVGLCEGNSQMHISPEPCQNINAEGTDCQNEFTITDPDCLNGPFTFAVITGSDFASIAEANEHDGTFKVHMQANNSVNIRSAVIRITSGCTALYKDFIFTQEGQSCDNLLNEAPEITSVPSGKNVEFCSGGSISLSVPSTTPGLEELIWTRNGVEIARGVSHIIVTQAGIYDVWMGIIGCKQKAGNAVTVKKSTGTAPDPVNLIVIGNNGLICMAGGTTPLIAQKSSSGTGTVRWFKNGVLQALTSPDNEVNAGAGQWYSAVNDGGCWSKPSQTATVSEETNSGVALITPITETSGSFCAGSTIRLGVNDATYNSTYTYTWYENDAETPLGVGRYIFYEVPSDNNNVIIRCRATKEASCASEVMSQETISAGAIPARPSITGDIVLCNGTATLNIVPVGTGNFTYAWYKHDQLLATSQSLTVSQGGDYYACVTEVGGCSSPLVHREVSPVTSALPTVTLNSSDNDPNLNDIVTYSATINFGPATSYKWTVNNAALQTGGGNTPNAVIKYDKTGPASVRVEVGNACGIGVATHSVANVRPACADPTEVFPSTPTSLNGVVGQSVTLGPVSVVFADGSPVPRYQWYKNSSNSNSGGTLIANASENSYIAKESSAGTYYYYCVVSNAGCSSAEIVSGVYTVTVSQNPATLPLGLGTFLGKTCFDINQSNHTGSCATAAARASAATNFATVGAVNYTFTASASGTKRDLRFVIIDTEEVIENWSGGKAGTIDNNEKVVLSINYKTTLNQETSNPKIWGRTRGQAAKVQVYAVYNDGSKEVSLPLTISIMDCICCPGYLAVGGEYVQKTSGYVAGGLKDRDRFEQISPYFRATGKDVCFYMADGVTFATYSTSVSNCSNGNYVGADYRSMGGWRLPNVVELGAIQNVYDKLSTQPNSASGTQDIAKANYWSISKRNSTPHYWSWRFNQNDIYWQGAKTTYRARCVRTME